MKWRKIRVTLR